MRFTAATVLAIASANAASAFVQQPHQRHSSFAPAFGVLGRTTASRLAQSSTQVEDSAASAAEAKATTKKEERLRMMKSDRFHRKGFKEARDKVEKDMEEQFQSSIVKDLRSSNFVMEKDGVKVYLAKVRKSSYVDVAAALPPVYCRCFWTPLI